MGGIFELVAPTQSGHLEKFPRLRPDREADGSTLLSIRPSWRTTPKGSPFIWLQQYSRMKRIPFYETLPMLTPVQETTLIKIMHPRGFLRASSTGSSRNERFRQYEGHVVVVQPLPFGRVKELKEQDGLYTLILQGINEEGKAVRDTRLIDVLDDFVNPYEDYGSFLHYGESKDLEVIVSNTTEAGICFEEKTSIDLERKLCPSESCSPCSRGVMTRSPWHGLPASLHSSHNGDRSECLRLAEARGMEEVSFLFREIAIHLDPRHRIVRVSRDDSSLCENRLLDNNM